MEKIEKGWSKEQKSSKHNWRHYDSTEWMDKIAETMSKVKNDPSLSYEEKRKILEDYRKAMSSIN